MLSTITQVEIAKKVHNAVTKPKEENFMLILMINGVEKVGKILVCVRYRNFTIYIEKIRTVLRSVGGKYEKINPYNFCVLQLLAMIIGVLFTVIFISADIFVIFPIGLLLFFLPFLNIKEKARKRRDLILKQLPNMVDLLSIILESGLGFYGAIEKVIQIMPGPLSDDFEDALSKIYLGYDKRTSLTEIAQKNGIERLSLFIRTLNLALESGTEIADTLKRLANSLRNDVFALAEKKAYEAPVKMLIPLVLLIFPTIFIVIFGPIVISFVKNGF
jgi:tight adherence protein C